MLHKEHRIFFLRHAVFSELEEKDEKFQQVAKQLDAKTQEALRYKTAAEVAKVTIYFSFFSFVDENLTKTYQFFIPEIAVKCKCLVFQKWKGNRYFYFQT